MDGQLTPLDIDGDNDNPPPYTTSSDNETPPLFPPNHRLAPEFLLEHMDAARVAFGDITLAAMVEESARLFEPESYAMRQLRRINARDSEIALDRMQGNHNRARPLDFARNGLRRLARSVSPPGGSSWFRFNRSASPDTNGKHSANNRTGNTGQATGNDTNAGGRKNKRPRMTFADQRWGGKKWRRDMDRKAHDLFNNVQRKEFEEDLNEPFCRVGPAIVLIVASVIMVIILGFLFVYTYVTREPNNAAQV